MVNILLLRCKYSVVIDVFIDAYITMFIYVCSNQDFMQEPERGTCVFVGVILWYAWDSAIFRCPTNVFYLFIDSLLGINECLYYCSSCDNIGELVCLRWYTDVQLDVKVLNAIL
jgi:hypothetical protein